MIKFKGIYSIVIGASMLIMWCMLLATNQVPEVVTEPYRIVLHILSELITAVMLIAGGVKSIKERTHSNILNNVALGALLYSVLNAAGYYLQKGDYAMLGMFGVFTVMSLYFILSSMLSNLSVGGGWHNLSKGDV